MSEWEETVRQGICGILAAESEALRGHRVLLFGSRARGSADERSDFDLAVDGGEPLDLKTFCRIEEALDALPTLYRVDWVDLNRASPKVRESARKEGKVLYEG